MDMVCHQTICPDLEAIFPAVFFEPAKILSEVIIIVKDGVLIVAPLGDVMRIINSNGSCYSWHKEKIAKSRNKSRKQSLSLFTSQKCKLNST